MPNAIALKNKAEKCLAQKSEMPMSPLWHMGMAAKFKSNTDLAVIQNAIDYLTCKAKAKEPFGKDENEFLTELYEAFWWGGQYHGYKEAAQLANHYVNGQGKQLNINPEIYQQSPIVIATTKAMKKYIADTVKNGTFVQPLRCDDANFRMASHSKPLLRMNYLTEGKMKGNGVLEAAQNNHRLQKSDGHFYLSSLTTIIDANKFITTWFIDSIYDFEPFEKHDYFTLIPLGENDLKLPDGLSEYMTQLGIAHAFHYKAQWEEKWD